MLPILYQSHDLILYSYPLLMGLGWGIAYQIFFSLLDPSFTKIKGQILFWGIFIAAWVGAKAFFFLTYPMIQTTDFISELSFWTGGGFVFYGGFIGGLLFIAAYKLIDKKFNFKILWAMIPSIAFGHGIGRLGCLLAGCCFGKPTDLFWGIYLHNHYRHPTQLLEALSLLLLGIYLLKSKKNKFILLSHYLISYGVVRIIIESLRGDSIRGLWGPFSPSQWISILLISLGLSFILLPKFRSLRGLN